MNGESKISKISKNLKIILINRYHSEFKIYMIVKIQIFIFIVLVFLL